MWTIFLAWRNRGSLYNEIYWHSKSLMCFKSPMLIEAFRKFVKLYIARCVSKIWQIIWNGTVSLIPACSLFGFSWLDDVAVEKSIVHRVLTLCRITRTNVLWLCLLPRGTNVRRSIVKLRHFEYKNSVPCHHITWEYLVIWSTRYIPLVSLQTFSRHRRLTTLTYRLALICLGGLRLPRESIWGHASCLPQLP